MAEHAEGFAKNAYDFFDKELRPLGYKLHAEIISFPGGMPGEAALLPEMVTAWPAHRPREGIGAMTKKAVVSQLREHDKYDRLLAATRGLQPLSTAVAHPCDESSLRGALDAARASLIVPILVGPKDKIKSRRRKVRARYRRAGDRRCSA